MRKTVLPLILAIALVLSNIPIIAFANDSDDPVKAYTTTSYGPDYPWWSLYHLTSAAAVDAGVKGGEGGQMVHSMGVSSDGTKLYYGTDTGGIWTSDDGGANWRLSQTGFVVNGAMDISIDPDNNDIAFAAGMLCAGALTNENTGIYRTTDGGANWSLVLNTDYYYIFTNKVIKFGAKHPDGHRTIYAGTHSKGVFKSDDGGDTWTNLGRIGDRIEDLYVDSTDADSPMIIEASEQSGVVVSSDGGTTWSPMNTGLPSTAVLSLAVNPADTSNWLVTLNGDKKLYKTTDGGATWSVAGDMAPVLSSNGQPYKLLFGAWDGIADHTPVLYIALSANSDALRYSTDLGQTFQTPEFDQTLVLRNQTGFWPEAFTVDTVNPWTVWAAIDGTIYKSTSEGSVELSPSSSGDSGMRVYDMLFDDAGNIQYIGVMDHGIYKAAPGYDTDYPPVSHLSTVQRWGGVWSCHDIVMDPNDSQHLYAKVGDWGGNLIIEESTDGGATWTQIEGTGGNIGGELDYNNKNDQVIYAGKLRSTDNGETWTPLTKTIAAVSPVDNNVVYAIGGSKIYKSTDMGDTWTPLKPIIGDGIQLITADGLKSDRLWVGTFNNGMYRIDGDVATHIGSDKLEASVNGNYGIFQIVQDPNNPFHYFAGGCDNTAHGPGAGVFESFDGGDTWALVPGMPGMRDIWRMNINPVKPLVYVCTSNGIMVYDWSKRTGLPTPEITPVQVDKYAEDFSDGLAQGWTLDGYQVHSSGVLYTEDWGTPSAIYDWQAAAAPFEYKVDAVSYTSEDSNRMKVIFNYQDASNYNYFDFGSAVPSAEQPELNPTVNLVKVVDGSEETIATKQVDYNFTGSVSTIDIKCSEDGKITVDAIRGGNATNLFTDIEDETFLSGGQIGVGSQACASGSFDNVSLMDATGVEAPSDTHDIITYTQGFDGGQAQDWSLSAGFAVDPSGVLYCNNGDEIALYNTGIATTPFEYKVDLLTWHGEDGNKMRVYFNYLDDTNYEFIEIGGGETPTIQLKKVYNGGSPATIATYSGVYSFHGNYGFTTLDIRCGNDGVFNVDAIRGGVTTHLFTDIVDPVFATGKIGVGTHAGFIAVDKIEVKSLAQTGPISYYTENFHDNTAQGWVYTDGVTVDQQCMHVEDWGGANMAIYDRQQVYAPYNYKINFFMWPTGNKDGVKIVFGYQDEDNYDCLLIGGGNDPAKIQKVVDGVAATLATSSERYDFSNSGTNSSPDPENTFEITCDADGKFNVDVIRNGVTVHLFTDITDPDVISGKIGVGTVALGSLYWTNVIVRGTAPVAPQTIEAINAIDVLPAAEDITLVDKPAVKAARDLVIAAYLNDGGAVITNIDKLEACEAKIQSLLLASVIEAIDDLPDVVDITLADKDAVESARSLVEELLTYGPDADISNINKLIGCEARIDYLNNIIGIEAEPAVTLAVNGTWQIDVDTTPDGALLKYESFDPDIAQVDKNGLITAKKPGLAFIRVTAMKSGWIDNSFAIAVLVEGDSLYSYTISNGSISTAGGGITANAKITHPVFDGRQGVVIFQLMKSNANGDIPVCLVKKAVGTQSEEIISVTFASYTGSGYYVKVMVWDKLDNDLNSIGTDLAEAVRLNP